MNLFTGRLQNPSFTRMEKRYQVFVSSTYADLKDERRRVIQTLMEIDCIPAGMELFPTADEEQFEFIKRVIDDCDYYLLIIGGRYGSTDPAGISYTEKEYDYAIERGLKVIALLHANPDSISVEKSDIAPELREKLAAFREKVSKGRLVKFWKSADELPGLVAINLSKTIKAYPAVGWSRANQIPTPEVLNEINTLQRENSQLKDLVNSLNAQLAAAPAKSLASFEDEFTVTGTYLPSRSADRKEWKAKLTWGDIFGAVGPYLLEFPGDLKVKEILDNVCFDKSDAGRGTLAVIDEAVYQTIKTHLMALNLVDLQYQKNMAGFMSLFWVLTPNGKGKMLSLRSVKAQQK